MAHPQIACESLCKNRSKRNFPAFQHLEIHNLPVTETSMFCYNLERLQHFHRPYEYGSTLVSFEIDLELIDAARHQRNLSEPCMEFTVSKADLVRELSLSQGVVEKKTTIPILSNVLLEADGDRIVLTATDLELGIRCSCPARVKKRAPERFRRKLLDYVRLLPDADVQSSSWRTLGQPDLRPLADAHCRHVARELSGAAANAGGDGRDSGEHAGVHDLADDFCDLDGRIALHVEWRAAVARRTGLTMVATDGIDWRW